MNVLILLRNHYVNTLVLYYYEYEEDSHSIIINPPFC